MTVQEHLKNNTLTRTPALLELRLKAGAWLLDVVLYSVFFALLGSLIYGLTKEAIYYNLIGVTISTVVMYYFHITSCKTHIELQLARSVESNTYAMIYTREGIKYLPVIERSYLATNLPTVSELVCGVQPTTTYVLGVLPAVDAIKETLVCGRHTWVKGLKFAGKQSLEYSFFSGNSACLTRFRQRLALGGIFRGTYRNSKVRIAELVPCTQ